MDVIFQYNSDEQRTCTVFLEKDNKIYASTTLNLASGQNKYQAITLSNDYVVTPVGLGYAIWIQFFDENNMQTAFYSQNVTVELDRQVKEKFTTPTKTTS